MKWFNELKLETKLIWAFIVLAGLPAIAISGLAYLDAADAIHKFAYKELHVMRESKAQAIEFLFHELEGQAKTLSNNKMTLDAYKKFSDAYGKYESEFTSVSADKAKDSLDAFYHSEFKEAYASKNNGRDNQDILDAPKWLTKNQIMLQYSYVSNNSNPLKSKYLLNKAEDGTEWSKVHGEYHASFKDYIKEFGYHDLFLIDITTGNVVYSVSKQVDFAVSLTDSHYRDNQLGKIYQMALKASGPNEVIITDLAKYSPAYDEPTAFVASAIYEGTKKVGVLALQLPVEGINKIMTGDGKWKEGGFGDTGEVYLVGADKKMRSQARLMVEDKAAYIAGLKKLNYKPDSIEYIDAHNTTVLEKVVDTEGMNDALKTGYGDGAFKNPKGLMVLSSYKKLNLHGLDWYILAEMNDDEALAGVTAMAKEIGVALIIALLGIGFFAWFFSRSPWSKNAAYD